MPTGRKSPQDRQVCRRAAKLLKEQTQGICALYVQHCLREPIPGEIIASLAPDVALLLKPTSALHHALLKGDPSILGEGFNGPCIPYCIRLRQSQ